jgi:hypothetical protein
MCHAGRSLLALAIVLGGTRTAACVVGVGTHTNAPPHTHVWVVIEWRLLASCAPTRPPHPIAIAIVSKCSCVMLWNMLGSLSVHCWLHGAVLGCASTSAARSLSNMHNMWLALDVCQIKGSTTAKACLQALILHVLHCTRCACTLHSVFGRR